MLGDFRQRLEAVDRGHDFTAHLFQQRFRAAAYGLAVIDDHDLAVKIDRLRRILGRL